MLQLSFRLSGSVRLACPCFSGFPLCQSLGSLSGGLLLFLPIFQCFFSDLAVCLLAPLSQTLFVKISALFPFPEFENFWCLSSGRLLFLKLSSLLIAPVPFERCCSSLSLFSLCQAVCPPCSDCLVCFELVAPVFQFLVVVLSSPCVRVSEKCRTSFELVALLSPIFSTSFSKFVVSFCAFL